MKKLKLSLIAILITIAVMPQAALFSMEQEPHIEYISQNSRRFNGRLQYRYSFDTYHDDGTVTNEEIWINVPSQQTPATQTGIPNYSL